MINMNITTTENQNADKNELKHLLDQLNEKDKVIRQVEKEIKKLTKSKEGIIKMVLEKDKELAHEMLEKIPEMERIITEEEEKKSGQNHRPSNKGNIKDFLKFQEDRSPKEERLPTDENKPMMMMKQIGLMVKEQGVTNKALFNNFQRELFAYYTNDTEKTKFEKEDEKGLQLDTIDKVEWQYVLVFKNPDYDKKKNQMSETDAFNTLFKLFRPDKRLGNYRVASNEEEYVYRCILQNTIDVENRNNVNYYALNKGGSFSKDENTNKWTYHNSQPRDLQTLFMNIALYKISKVLNLKTATLLSEQGDYIYVLIHANEDILREEADWQEYPLEFDVGSTDLVSMEPCDKRLRPYRFVVQDKPSEIKQLEDELKGFSDIIYGAELELLSSQSIRQQAKISEKEWTAYKHFLDFIQLHRMDTINLIHKYPDLKGLIVRELYEAAIEHVKTDFEMELKNIWSYYDIPPSGAYKSYYREIDRIMDTDKADHFWKRYVSNKGEVSILSNVDKIKLTLSKLFSQLRLDKMKSYGYLENCFPLHSWDYNLVRKYVEENKEVLNPPKENQVMNFEDEKDRDEKMELVSKLRQKENNFSYVKSLWTYSLIGRIPTNAIRNYFGEKVALYYEFLSLYTLYLFVLSFLGIAVYIIQLTEPLESQLIEYFYELGYTKSLAAIVGNTLYSFLVIIWSTIFLEHWKRRDNLLSTEWGQFNYQSDEDKLPSFHGKKRRSPVNDAFDETFYPYVIHVLKKLLAYLISLIIVAVVIAIVIALLYWRNLLVIEKTWGAENKIIVNIPTVLNSIQIAVFNQLYKLVAKTLNDFENNKTYDSYESSLAAKIFIFQFVNNFNSLIIIGFIKRYIGFMGGCVKNTQFGKSVSTYNYCDQEMENQMVTIALINFATNFSELGLPWLMNWWKNRGMKKENDGNAHEMQEIVKPVEELRRAVDFQNNLGDFNDGYIDATFQDYMELCVQFGFVNLFALSFTLLPVIAFVTNILEMYVDKTKLLYLLKRPNPISTESIGNWYYILEIISFVSIFSNLGILIFTYNNYYELDTYSKIVLFMCLVFFYIIVKLVLSLLIPDVSEKDSELRLRQEYIIDKMCDGLDQESEAKIKYKVDLNVLVKNN